MNLNHDSNYVPRPGLLRKAVNFAEAVIKHVANGMPEADDETYYARLGVCEKCPFRGEGWTCNACGCKLLIKARWSDMDCPICARCGRLDREHPVDGCEGFVSKWQKESQPDGQNPSGQRRCCG